jgi:hypothetical protein
MFFLIALPSSGYSLLSVKRCLFAIFTSFLFHFVGLLLLMFLIDSNQQIAFDDGYFNLLLPFLS